MNPALRIWLVLVFLLTGCGGALSSQRAEGMHDVLDVVTQVVDPLYASAVISCDGAEGVVIARPDSTEERDRADVARVREVCDRMYAGFEAVRQAQLAARQAVDAARDGENTDRLLAAVQAVQRLHEAAQAARGMWEEAEPVLQEITGGGDG